MSVGTIVLGVLSGAEQSWTSSETYGYFSVGGVGLLLFIVWEVRAKQLLLNVQLFEKPLFFPATMTCAAGGTLSGIPLFINPLYF
ncbi:hypothetical protein [Candidatus Coxiella mudrowiae]|uniref:hypothetical protein n=1 Tax=Candidatus Coxiella mudrowiae TaxID=2054173 RepID=UPI000662274A|nr:hypothetical protein [Candidatus Coxiella mudrowiae]